ncbi:MAG: prepilin peptidase [Pseudanabaenaceae cyanobacterium SKYGB_i_bin29]|nr:prepilin peptidase [Pseudanabaenaceae cyanobacterium SKYG29]MDW8421958.1 prepilin peptidase [Pseudanabaenaceae cyanobacterium SKYGB_i_bin29]
MLFDLQIVLLPTSFILGACVGSFINVVVYRLPLGISIIYPPSRCPSCQTRLTPRDNIPILGWLILRGKCRYCGAPISWRYPTVELLVALLFLALVWRFGAELGLASLLLLGAFIAWLTTLALIDIDTETLPNSLTQSGLILGICYHALLSTSPQTLAQNLIASTIGIVLGIWSLSLLGVTATIFLGKEAMGGGDPKLLGMIGAWLGWQAVLVTTLIAALLGVTLAGIGKLLGRSVQRIRFGPCLALGGLGALFWGQYLTEQYLRWFFFG